MNLYCRSLIKLLFLISFLLTSSLIASTPTFSVSSSVDRQIAMIGEEIKYTINIKFDPSLAIQKPGPQEMIGTFEVRDVVIPEMVVKNNVALWQITYILISFEPGNYTLPSFDVIATINNKNVTLTTPSIKLTINTLSAEELAKEELRGLKPQVLPKGKISLRNLLILILVPLFIIGLIFLYIFRDKIFPRKEVPLTAWEVALAHLGSLREAKCIERKDFKSFYYELSMIYRTFLQTIFNVPCIHLTTRQIIDAFQTIEPLFYSVKDKEPKQIPSPKIDQLTLFLQYADKVKFAGELAQTEIAKEDIKKITEYIWSVRAIYESFQKEEL